MVASRVILRQLWRDPLRRVHLIVQDHAAEAGAVCHQAIQLAGVIHLDLLAQVDLKAAEFEVFEVGFHQVHLLIIGGL